VQDQEVKFGYAVTGSIDPARVLSNAGARAGDVLVLTKPLGTGIITTALKFDRAQPEHVAAAIASMTRLNRAAAETLAGLPPGAVRACTDITGFGLLGHGSELAIASGVTLEIRSADVPLLPGVRELARRNRSGGLGSNEAHFGAAVHAATAVDPALLTVLYDPQTSGGLLASLDAAFVDTAIKTLQDAGTTAVPIGRILPRQPGVIARVV
jgi:selenide,water dikinase